MTMQYHCMGQLWAGTGQHRQRVSIHDWHRT